MPGNACFCNISSTGIPRLRRVLRAIAWLYPDIGYCQGTGIVRTFCEIFGSIKWSAHELHTWHITVYANCVLPYSVVNWIVFWCTYFDMVLWYECLTGLGFDLAWLSCLPSTSVSSLYLVLYVEKVFDYISLPFSVLSLWDWPLTWKNIILHCYCTHCWLSHLTCKIVSEMTYNVSSGTLNPTTPIPYPIIFASFITGPLHIV